MNWTKIYWEKGVYSIKMLERMDLEGYEFYAVLAGEAKRDGSISDCRLLYIGKAFGKETVLSRIKNPTESADERMNQYFGYSWNQNKIPVYIIGSITHSIFVTISSMFILDIECCLIFDNKPYANTICKQNYPRKRSILVFNEGDYEPLKEMSIVLV